MTRLGPIQRAATSALRAMMRLGAGYDLGPIQTEMVRIHGIRGALRLIKLGADVSFTLSRAVGDYTAQTLIGLAALWNGCRFCTIGHIYSANLFLFESQGVLGPVDENDLIELMYMTDEESYAALKEMLAAPEHSRTWRFIDRMYQLRFRDLEPAEDEDEVLKAALAYWEWLNECTIILGVDAKPGTVPALGYVRPSAKLLVDYDRAREADRAAKASASPPATPGTPAEPTDPA